jgi:hypothetical protein
MANVTGKFVTANYEERAVEYHNTVMEAYKFQSMHPNRSISRVEAMGDLTRISLRLVR